MLVSVVRRDHGCRRTSSYLRPRATGSSLCLFFPVVLLKNQVLIAFTVLLDGECIEKALVECNGFI
jgi:hypothetical protein